MLVKLLGYRLGEDELGSKRQQGYGVLKVLCIRNVVQGGGKVDGEDLSGEGGGIEC